MKKGKIFPNRIEELRKEKGLTQSGLASELEDMGVPVTLRTIRNYEKGFVMPSDALICLCKLFDCSTDYILRLTDCRTVDNALIRQKTGLTDAAITKLNKHRADTTVNAVNVLLSRLGSSAVGSDLLTLITAYLYRPDGSDIGDIYFRGDGGNDIVISGDDSTNGALLAIITSKLTDYRTDLIKRKKKKDGKRA